MIARIEKGNILIFIQFGENKKKWILLFNTFIKKMVQKMKKERKKINKKNVLPVNVQFEFALLSLFRYKVPLYRKIG